MSLTSACRSAGRDADGVSSPPNQPLAPPAALIRVIADGEGAALASLPSGPGQGLVQGTCVTCHGAALIEQQHKDSAGWAKTIGQMRAWGSPLPAEQVPTLVAYLTARYGVAVAPH